MTWVYPATKPVGPKAPQDGDLTSFIYQPRGAEEKERKWTWSISIDADLGVGLSRTWVKMEIWGGEALTI